MCRVLKCVEMMQAEEKVRRGGGAIKVATLSTMPVLGCIEYYHLVHIMTSTFQIYEVL